MSRTVRATRAVVLAPEDALALWADTRRWSSFVEGFARLEELSPQWPQAGARVVWHSGRGGRGRVTETVAENGPRRFSTRVFEERLAGTQTAEAVPAAGGGAQIAVALEYSLARATPLTAVSDLLFIRQALRAALERTLARFAVEAEDEAGLR